MPQQNQDLAPADEPGTDASVQTLCRNFVYRFYERYDQAAYAQLVQMFMPDGSWYRANQLLRGREQIIAALQQRPARRRSLHAVCNLQILPGQHGHVDLRYWLTVIRSDEAPEAEAPATIASASMVLSASAEILMQADGPRFTRKTLKREFLFAPA
jgi:hypothetical protein